MKIKAIIFCFIIALNGIVTNAQHYEAINGSNYAGSLGGHNNPASIVNTPYKWDITLFGIQAQAATNIIRIENYSILSPASKSQYYVRKGDFERKGAAQANINLLNTRIAINQKKAFAFGANIRTNARINTSTYYFIDTLQDVRDYLEKNLNNQPLSMNLIQSGWLEIYGSYAQTIIDNDFMRLNAGATVKLSRGLSGAQARLENGRFQPIYNPNTPFSFLISNGDTRYGYSSNYDKWQKNASTTENLRTFVTNTQGGAAIDAGAELLIKTQAVATAFDDDDYFDYKWKLGVSFLDLGANQYGYSKNGRSTTGILPNITNVDINQKFDSTTTNIASFNDSLATVVAQMSSLAGKFRIWNPARLLLNADYYIQGDFYVNASLSINLSPLAGNKRLYVRDMSRFIISPRWETRKWGVYLPVSFNAENKLWIGGAFKAGPLLFGLHNLGYVFSKKTIHNGGGYIALIIKAPTDTGKRRDKREDCPPGTFR